MSEHDIYRIFLKSQDDYLNTRSKDYLKKNSQFFTPLNIADKMLDTIDKNYFESLDKIRILEPSAGCGILILKLVLYIVNNTNIKYIKIDAYEINKDLSIILKNNLRYLKEYLSVNATVSLKTRVYNENFILKNSSKWKLKNISNGYNLIISNPPFRKINKISKEAIALNEIVFGQPNIYVLFIALCLKLLIHNGIYIFISPRNYLNGMYTEKLRKYAFTNFTLRNIHTFDNRNIFKFTNQEIIISTFVNNRDNSELIISHNGKFKYISTLNEILYDKKDYSLLIPKDKKDISLIKRLYNFKYNLAELGISISVGPIVQFRNEQYLSRNIYKKDFAPLLISKDIIDNKITYYGRKNVLKTHNKSISTKAKNLIKNSNYLLLQKVMAKDDRDPIVAAVLKKDYLHHELLGLDNNILYFHRIDTSKELLLSECYGLFCYINSSYFQKLYLLINGNHTINISDFRNIKFPSLDLLNKMGNELIKINKLDKISCSNVFKKYLENFI
jgi:adenine-specific DNA-methyltransferase